MVKQKNHTNRNMTFKAHKNGIKKQARRRYRSTKGMDNKFLRNQKYAKRFNNVVKSEEEE